MSWLEGSFAIASGLGAAGAAAVYEVMGRARRRRQESTSSWLVAAERLRHQNLADEVKHASRRRIPALAAWIASGRQEPWSVPGLLDPTLGGTPTGEVIDALMVSVAEALDTVRDASAGPGAAGPARDEE